MTNHATRGVLLLGLLAGAPSLASAQIYRCQIDGVVVYRDKACDARDATAGAISVSEQYRALDNGRGAQAAAPATDDGNQAFLQRRAAVNEVDRLQVALRSLQAERDRAARAHQATVDALNFELQTLSPAAYDQGRRDALKRQLRSADDRQRSDDAALERQLHSLQKQLEQARRELARQSAP